jgi:hypothetical protein
MGYLNKIKKIIKDDEDMVILLYAILLMTLFTLKIFL